jgi:hypothetical protein
MYVPSIRPAAEGYRRALVANPAAARELDGADPKNCNRVDLGRTDQCISPVFAHPLSYHRKSLCSGADAADLSPSRLITTSNLLLLLLILTDPIIQALPVPGYLNGVELHPRHEYGAFLCVFCLGTGADHGAKVVVIDLVLIRHHKFAPPLLALGALHYVLVNGGGGVELGEVFLQVLKDVVVQLGQTQGGALYSFEDRPVCLHMLNDFDGKLLLHLGCDAHVSKQVCPGLGANG